MSLPQWSTPVGFLGTITERLYSSFSLSASNNPTYSVISGELPRGLRISNTGTIDGTAFSVGEVIRSTFVVRAATTSGVTDRTFIIDTQGPSEPQWITSSGYLPLGEGNQLYIINKQFVDYKLNAIYDTLPAGQQLRYFISDQDGQLPPGITLNSDGRLVGFVTDTLGIDVQSSISGGYDEGKYDGYPYDYITVNEITGTQRPKYLSKIYQFYVTVTDGVASSKRLFKIKVEDPSSLRVDTSLIDVDTVLYTVDSSFLMTPQWLSPANLGVVRANNKQVIQLSTYDAYPNTGPTTYDWTTPTLNQDGSLSVHPTHFQLTTSTGVLYATLPYQPAFSETFKFTVRIVKTDIVSQATSYRDKTFTLTVKGDVDNTIEFVSSENLGTLAEGYQSELLVIARHTAEDISMQYTLVVDSNNGERFPPGLSLSTDGTIIGKIDYNSRTQLDFTLDNGITTVDSRYYFTIVANDIYRKGAVSKQFYITVSNESNKEYTKIYVKPFMNKDSRLLYSEFIEDPRIFDSALIYRPNDSEFGVQRTIKLAIEYGIERIKLNDYIDNMRDYFYKKQFFFGNVKVAKGEDSNRNHVYDLVYVDIIDPLDNLQGPVTIGNVTVYPNSVTNLRNQLEKIKIQGNSISVDEFFRPKFMRTVQPDTGAPLGFILAAPLCYTVPNKGDTIVKRIAASNFDFKVLDFEIDRLIVEDNLTSLGNKYLIFPKKDLQDFNTADSLSFVIGPDNQVLLTEDGIPLQTEL